MDKPNWPFAFYMMASFLTVTSVYVMVNTMRIATAVERIAKAIEALKQ